MSEESRGKLFSTSEHKTLTEEVEEFVKDRHFVYQDSTGKFDTHEIKFIGAAIFEPPSVEKFEVKLYESLQIKKSRIELALEKLKKRIKNDTV